MSDLQYRNEKWLREQFKKYKTPTEVSRQTGYPRTNITRYAKKFGIYATDRTRIQKIHIKNNYFENIDASDKAYFLGFIMADGCMYQKKDGKYQFSIKIKNTDDDILKSFCDYTEFDKTKIRYRNSERKGTVCNCAEIQINDQVFCNYLLNLGIVPRKSGKEFMPNCNGFEVDFIRGYIDGDGWIYNHYRCDCNGHRYEIGFCSSSFNVIQSINNYILDNFNIKMLVSQQKGVYTSKICSKYKVFKILNKIYYDDCLSLNRKNEIAQKIKKDIYNELF